MARAERSGLRRERAALLGSAHGRVLEIGAGTGLNVEHYGAAVRELVLSEPDEEMARRLEARAERREGTTLVRAPADALPFDDARFDNVVSTLVLCSVPDQAAVLREVRRVLAPGGSLLLYEHISAEPGTRLARWQRRLNRPWRRLGRGCNVDRDLRATLAAESFAGQVEVGNRPFMPVLTRRVLVGAVRPV